MDSEKADYLHIVGNDPKRDAAATGSGGARKRGEKEECARKKKESARVEEESTRRKEERARKKVRARGRRRRNVRGEKYW